MVERNVKIPKKENPVLLDKVIQDIQDTLAEKLKWLNYAFGRAYKLVEHNSDGSKFIYPAAYIGNSEYVSLLPNDNFGNFSWFDLYDPQEITAVVQSLPQFTFSGALVFWFDLNSIFADADDVFQVPTTDALLVPIIEIIPLQLFAYYVAKMNGCDIDKPKNLAKSVTVE